MAAPGPHPPLPIAAVDDILRQIRYRNPPGVRQQVLDACRFVPSLKPTVDSFISEVGEESRLLTLQGTMPIYFRGTAYNIPMAIYIPEHFPQHSPFAYVRPTATMAIHPRHKHVSPEGRCYFPYLSNWKAGESSIYEMINHLASIFSSEPPVYAKPTTPPSSQPPSASASFQPSSQPSSGAKTPPLSASLSSQFQQSLTLSADQKLAQDQQNKMRLVDLLTTKLSARAQEEYNKVAKEMEDLLRTQDDLGKRWSAICNTQREVATEKQHLERENMLLQERINGIEAVLKEAENGSEKKEVEVLMNEVISEEPLKQYLEVSSESKALEDVLSPLDRALRNGGLDLETYLRFVRQISRQQFLKKALAKKIAAQCAAMGIVVP